MRIAKPLLVVATPIGLALGLIEAWRLSWKLALLMAAMLSVVGAFAWMTIRRIRGESRGAKRGSA